MKKKILVTILIIEIIVFIFNIFYYKMNQHTPMVAPNIEKEAFNLKWSSFIGERVSASTVNVLISSVISTNEMEFSNATNNFVTIFIKSNSKEIDEDITIGPVNDNVSDISELQTNKIRVSATTSYKVEVANGAISGYTSSGLIRYITVTAN